MTDWILFITFLGYSTTYPVTAIDGFSSQQACEQAYNDIKSQTGWSDTFGRIHDHNCVQVNKEFNK